MKLYVIGIGPGDEGGLTHAADAALSACDVIAGYALYLDLIRDRYPHKVFLSTPMRGEAERCRRAIEAALRGQTVGMVCSGDPGVYGMAGLIYQLSQEYPPIEIEVVPGVSAALSGAALLGAPLTNDFAVVSLSDLLTPWAAIERRLNAAAEADFALCLYNPASKKRTDHLARACDIVRKHRDETTPCGVAVNIARVGQSRRILTLGELRHASVDMFSTVFIGNSSTRVIGGALVTPRGYKAENA